MNLDSVIYNKSTTDPFRGFNDEGKIIHIFNILDTLHMTLAFYAEKVKNEVTYLVH